MRRVEWWRLVRGAASVVLLLALLAGCTIFPTRSVGRTPSPYGSLGAVYATDTPSAATGTACPAWTTPAPAISVAPPADASPQAIAQYNAARVVQTSPPIRNLYAITQHIVTHAAQPIPCRVRTTPRNDAVGQVTQFNVVSASLSGFHSVAATLVYVTPHLYMYVQQGAHVDMEALRAAADRFERSTLAKDTATFGAQWTPGPDGDQHITVLHALNLGPIGGYYSSEDEYPRAVQPYSNERQMIYVNLSGGVTPGDAFYDATLAHEFQHMIHWFRRPADDSWLNEGMSVLAQHLNGYTAGGVDVAFLRQPDTMLGGWTDDQQADVAHYGAGYLFLDYFAEHYGGAAVLRELLADPAPVPLNFDHVLQAHGSPDRFENVFAKYVAANLLNDPVAQGGIYAYPTIPNQRATVQRTVTAYPFVGGSDAAPLTTPQYAAQYIDLRPASGATPGTLSVAFQGDPYTRIVANTPDAGAGAEWWSNSANQMDSTLTHRFDLTALRGQPVTLNLHAWYNLEPDFDYGYVAVSTDEGQNWSMLRATTSTETNPNGANVGHGLTGISGGGTTPTWVQESVDLSAYAGQHIQLRFESITDDAVHYDGMTVDAIQIPQLHFSDTVASDNGWQANGWIRSNNVLPQRWLAQAVVYPANGAAPQVRQLPVDAGSGAGTLTLADFGGAVAHVTLILSALAPATTVLARYHLSAQVG